MSSSRHYAQNEKRPAHEFPKSAAGWAARGFYGGHIGGLAASALSPFTPGLASCQCKDFFGEV